MTHKKIVFTLALFPALFGFSFLALSPVQINKTFPTCNAEKITPNSQIIIEFNQPIKRREIEIATSPAIYGEWKFENSLIEKHLFQTLIFTPAIDFQPNTIYEIKLKNIKGFNLNPATSFDFNFKTKPLKKTAPDESVASGEPRQEQKKKQEPEITILEVPIDWQDYSLSCEAASLKMALAYKSVYVSEDKIMEKIGYDPTPHQGNIWGDPNKAYVGDIKGKICQTGYGVHWGPTAKAANNWREAESFINGNLEKIIYEIKNKNPVIVWGTLPAPLHNYSWHTPEGKLIQVYKETHVRLVIGFIGPSENPLKIILNDPYAGRLYWSTSYFLKNWESFNKSGVVVK